MDLKRNVYNGRKKNKSLRIRQNRFSTRDWWMPGRENHVIGRWVKVGGANLQSYLERSIGRCVYVIRASKGKFLEVQTKRHGNNRSFTF